MTSSPDAARRPAAKTDRGKWIWIGVAVLLGAWLLLLLGLSGGAPQPDAARAPSSPARKASPSGFDLSSPSELSPRHELRMSRPSTAPLRVDRAERE